MVFFTCSHCGESVKKSSVAKHYQTKCRNQIPFLTCVDCLKDFKENEYESHTKCLTEEERYSAKGFVPKASSGKGERKQRAWSACAHGLLSSGILKADEKNFLQSIVKFDNLPKKKGKFINFIKTSAKEYVNKPELISRVWEKLENYFKEANSENESKPEMKKNSTDSNGKKKCDEKVEKTEEMLSEVDGEKKKKKRKKHSIDEKGTNEVENEDKKKKMTEEEQMEEPRKKKSKKCEEVEIKVDNKENVEEQKNEENQSSFNWKEIILNILSRDAKDNQITLKKLEKKVLKKYCKSFGCQVDDKIVKKFSKKLNKMKEVTINGDCVFLSK